MDNPSAANDHLYHQRLLVCSSCQDLGYSPDADIGLRSYKCIGGHERGHKAFPSQLFRNVSRGHTSAAKLVCKVCKKRPQVKCIVPSCAKGHLPEWDFEQSMLRSAQDLPRMFRVGLHIAQRRNRSAPVYGLQTEARPNKVREGCQS